MPGNEKDENMHQTSSSRRIMQEAKGMDLARLRASAVDAVAVGMDLVKEWRASGRDVEAQTTGGEPGDEYVTAVDYAAETAVIEALQTSSPDIPIVGEMSGGQTDVDRVWVIDPIDGTTNFVLGKSFVAVTVALLVDGRPVVGATGCPFTGELWSAAEGVGAFDATGRRIVMEPRPAGQERIALDPQTSGQRTLAAWNDVFGRLTQAFSEVQPLSAIALELAYVAAGEFDGFVQIGGSPIQDFAAGTLLIREAGGVITHIDGSDTVWDSKMVIAGTPATHRRLRELLKGVC
jgi:myo-inositol-1(or 4)-monophosphatase